MATETDGAYDYAHGGGHDAVPWSRATKAFAVRNLRKMLRTKATIIWGFGFPAFWYFVTSKLFLPSAASVGGTAVLADVKGATAVTLGLFGVMTVTLVAFASALAADLDRKRYRKLRSLPVPPSADFAGRFLAGLVVAAVAYVLVLVAGFLDGADYALRAPSSIAVVAGSFVLFSLVGVSVAVVVVRVVDDPEIVTGVTNAVMLVVYFLTGYNGMSPELLPERTQFVVNVAPNALAARLQAWHLTETAATGTAAGGTSYGPGAAVPLPIGAEHVALLVAWAIGLGAVATVVMRRAFHDGEGGE